VDGQYQLRGMRVGAVIAVAAVAAFAVWYFAIRDTGSSGPSQATTTSAVQSIGAVEKSPGEIAGLAKKFHQPIYWAGPQPNTKLEFTRTGNGATYVRYLPPGEKAGERKTGYLTVVTFPFKGAYEALKGLAKKGGRITDQVGNGGVVLTSKDSPHVYLGFKRVDYEIEVYDPDPARALSIGKSGVIRPIG